MRFYVSVYLFIAGIYLLTASGRIGLSDNVAMFNVTQSIVSNGSFSAEPCDPNLEGHPNHCVLGKDGRYYAGFGLLPSVAAVPAILSARLVSKVAHVNPLAIMRLSVSLFTAVISPLVCVVFAMWTVGLGYSRQTAVVAAGVLAFGSPFWHYAVKGFYSEPYFALGLVLAAYLASCSESPYASILAGLAFGAACGSRIIGMIMFPAFNLFLFLKNRERKLPKTRLLCELAFFTVSFFACAALIGWSNYSRFGDVLKTGYQAAFPSTSALLSNPLLRGMGELLFSNEVGLFVFAPWIFVSLIAFPLFLREHLAESALCGAIFLSNLLFFARYPSWHGGMVAGPRLLIATLPFLVLVLVPYIEGLRTARAQLRNRLPRAVAVGLIAAAFLVQAFGSLYPESRYYILTRFYEDRSTKPWWTGSIPLASLDFLSRIRATEQGSAEQAAPVNPDPLAVSRQEEFAFASMRTAANEQDFLRSFPNSVNLILPDLILAKMRPLGLPRPILFGYFTVSAIACLLGTIGILKYSKSASKVRLEATYV